MKGGCLEAGERRTRGLSYSGSEWIAGEVLREAT